MSTKTVHFIRHGHSTFNALWEVERRDPMLYDAPLSDLGARQVAALAEQAEQLEPALVITSPLTRALQTAKGAFGHLAVPFLVDALLREPLNSSCDIGRSPSVLASEFPDLDFRHLNYPWWYCPNGIPFTVQCEPEVVAMARVRAFSQWLAARPEQTVAVIGHSTFFHLMIGRVLQNCEVCSLQWPEKK